MINIARMAFTLLLLVAATTRADYRYTFGHHVSGAECVGYTETSREAVSLDSHGQLLNDSTSDVYVVCPLHNLEILAMEPGADTALADKGYAALTVRDASPTQNLSCFFDAHNPDGTLRAWTSMNTSGSSTSYTTIAAQLDWPNDYASLFTLECTIPRNDGSVRSGIASYLFITCEQSDPYCP